MRDNKVGLTQPIPKLARVGSRDATLPIEPELRRAHDIFASPKVAKDVVTLLERFFFFKLGHDGNEISSARNAIKAVCDFLHFTKTPPWQWTSRVLYEYLAEMKVKDLAASTIRSRHYYIKSMCDSMMSDRDIVNKIAARHSNCSFVQITDATSRALVRGFAKRKRKLNNPSPDEMQQLYDHMESEFIEAIEVGKPIPYVLLRDRLIIAMFDAFGLRLSELINVNVDDFDFNPETPSYERFGILHVIGKGRKLRHIPLLTSWIYPVLKTYVDQIRPHWTDNVNTPEDDRKALFISNFGCRMSDSAIQEIVKSRFHKAGVTRNFSPHRLRNGFITRVADQMGLQIAAKLAGHSFAATTEGYYDTRSSLAGDPLINHVNNIYHENKSGD